MVATESAVNRRRSSLDTYLENVNMCYEFNHERKRCVAVSHMVTGVDGLEQFLVINCPPASMWWVITFLVRQYWIFPKQ